MKVDIALPCATQNELNGEDAMNLINNGTMCIGEISNMGCTPEAIDAFIAHKKLYAPGKAVNAGGVATSGLEMSQNAMHLSWSAAEVAVSFCTILHALFVDTEHNAVELFVYFCSTPAQVHSVLAHFET